MQIRYVVSTMVFWWRENHLSFEQECDYLRSLGFGIELYPTLRGSHDCRYEQRNWPRLREATKDMLVSLKSRDDGPTIDEWAHQLDCAKMLNAPMVADLQSLCISDRLGIADWGFAADVMNLANEKGVQLCMETGTLPALGQVIDKFPSMRCCLDTGYMHISRFDFRDYVDRLAEKTTYLHLTDNYGSLDDHQPPGLRGGIPRENWDYLLEKLSQSDHDIIGCLEMFPSMPGVLIRKGCEFLFDEMGWPSRPTIDSGFSSYRPV